MRLLAGHPNAVQLHQVRVCVCVFAASHDSQHTADTR